MNKRTKIFGIIVLVMIVICQWAMIRNATAGYSCLSGVCYDKPDYLVALFKGLKLGLLFGLLNLGGAVLADDIVKKQKKAARKRK